MKKILLSSFFFAFGIAAMAQVKPAAKRAALPLTKANTEAVQKANAAHIAWKNKIVAEGSKAKPAAASAPALLPASMTAKSASNN